jgi:phage terminase small subunit
MDATLTFRQERFVFEYLKDQNASGAAARAGYTARNMASQGNELLNNPAVRDRVRFEMQSLLAEIRCSALELMKQRMRAAFFDAGKLLKGWDPIALEELDEETRRAVEVKTVTRKSGPVVHVKQPDRHRALRALEKVHERLDRLNEQYYAKLEKAGQIPSLEEIERRADESLRAEAEESARDISEKRPERSPLGGPQVLSGSQPGAGIKATQFSEKHQVFSGSESGAGTRALLFSEKPMVLSGPVLGRATASGAASRCSTMNATASC